MFGSSAKISKRRHYPFFLSLAFVQTDLLVFSGKALSEVKLMLRLRLSGDDERQVQAASDRCGSRVLGAAEPACDRDHDAAWPQLPSGRAEPLRVLASQ